MVFFAKNMRWLSFLARVAFICNLLFLLCMVIRYTHNFIAVEFFKNIVIVLGWVLSLVMNSIVNPTEVVLILTRKPSPTQDWLRVSNFIFFLFQIIILFFV